MCHGGTNLNGYAGNGSEPCADVVHDLLLAPVTKDEGHLKLRVVDTEGVLVKLRTASLAANGLHLGYGKQSLLHPMAYAVGLLKGDARKGTNAYGERPLVEWRKEAAPKGGKAYYGNNGEDGRDGKNLAMSGERTAEQTAIYRLELAGDIRLREKFSAARTAARKQIAAQHGGEREGYKSGGAKSRDEGDAQRNQQATLHATEEEEGHKAGNDDKRGVENGQTDFLGSVEDDGQGRLPEAWRQGAVLAQPAVHVLDIHYGIVDKRANGYGHAAKAHGVDGEPKEMEGQYRYQQGERYGDERYDGSPDIHEEQEEHDDNKESTLVKRLHDIVDGAVDEPLLTVYV